MAMEQGPKYIVCKEGLIKLLVIALSCVTFAVLADTRYFGATEKMKWVFAAFIVSCAVSLLFYILRISNLSSRMEECGPFTFDAFDFVWSWFSAMWCLAAAAVYATDFPSQGDASTSWYIKLICGLLFAFLTGIMYCVEAYCIGRHAPARLGYIATGKGWLKTSLVALGAAAFGLLVNSGYPWKCSVTCEAAITYTLIAFVVGWSITTIIWILRISGFIPADRRSKFRTVEFAWSIICVLLFLSGLSCFAVFLRDNCKEYKEDRTCQKRLSSIIIAGANVILHMVDAVFNKPTTAPSARIQQ